MTVAVTDSVTRLLAGAAVASRLAQDMPHELGIAEGVRDVPVKREIGLPAVIPTRRANPGSPSPDG